MSVEKENAKFVLRERRGCRGDSQRRRGRSTTQPVCVVQCPLTKNPSKKEKKKKRPHKAGLQRAEERSPEWGMLHKMGAAAAAAATETPF